MKTLALLSLSLAVALALPAMPPGVEKSPVFTKVNQLPLLGDLIPLQGHVVVENPAPQAILPSKEHQEKVAEEDLKQNMAELEVKVKPDEEQEVKAEPEAEVEKAGVVELEVKGKPEVKVEEKSEAQQEVKTEAEVPVEAKAQMMNAEAGVNPEGEGEQELKDDPKFQVESKVEPDQLLMELEPEGKHMLDEENYQEHTQLQADPGLKEEGEQEEKAEEESHNDNEEDKEEEDEKEDKEEDKKGDKKKDEEEDEEEDKKKHKEEDKKKHKEEDKKKHKEEDEEEDEDEDEKKHEEEDEKKHEEEDEKKHEEEDKKKHKEEDKKKHKDEDKEEDEEEDEKEDEKEDKEEDKKKDKEQNMEENMKEDKKEGKEEDKAKNEVVKEPIIELESLDSNSPAEPLPEEEELFRRKRDYVSDEEQVMELDPEMMEEPIHNPGILQEGPALDIMEQPVSVSENYFPNEEAKMAVRPEEQESPLAGEEKSLVQLYGEPETEDQVEPDDGEPTGLVSEEENQDLMEATKQNRGRFSTCLKLCLSKRAMQGKRSCPGVVLGEKCYQFFKEPKTAANAELFCQEFPGGHLASITSNHNHGELMKMILKENGKHTRTWIGGLRFLDTGRFIWLDGSKWDYTDWLSGEPNNTANKENCLEVLPYGNGTFNDFTCWEPQAFICSYYD